MYPVLIVLVIIGAFVLWFLCSFAFFPLGKFLYNMWKDAMKEMEKDEDDEEEFYYEKDE